MKNFLLTTLVLILVPAVVFIPVYAVLIYNFKVNAQDYSEDIQGQWNAIQYYYENERVACDDDVWMIVTFDGDSIVVQGTILPQAESNFTWDSGTSLSYQADGKDTTFFLSFDSNNNLKIIVDNTPYIIILRNSER